MQSFKYNILWGYKTITFSCGWCIGKGNRVCLTLFKIDTKLCNLSAHITNMIMIPKWCCYFPPKAWSMLEWVVGLSLARSSGCELYASLDLGILTPKWQTKWYANLRVLLTHGSFLGAGGQEDFCINLMISACSTRSGRIGVPWFHSMKQCHLAGTRRHVSQS